MDNVAQLIAMAIVAGLGWLGGTVRYLHEVGNHDEPVSFLRYITHTLTGMGVAVTAGLLTSGYGIEGPMQHGFVAVAAMSSRELLDLIPRLIVRQVENFSAKKAK